MYTFKMSWRCFQQNKLDVIIMVALMAFYFLNLKCRNDTAKVKQYVEDILPKKGTVTAPIYTQKITFIQSVK